MLHYTSSRKGNHIIILDCATLYFKGLYEMAMSLDSSGATLDIACTDGPGPRKRGFREDLEAAGR